MLEKCRDFLSADFYDQGANFGVVGAASAIAGVGGLDEGGPECSTEGKGGERERDW